MAARTVTSTVRILECLPPLVRDDGRICVVFAHDPTSAFGDGVLDLLLDAGCRVMPWDQLEEIEPDLILSASENVDLPDGECPVLVLPHGVGFQKMVPDARGSGERLSGMVPDALLETGRAWLAVSHPDQEEQLLAAWPKTAGRTLLIGDPCFDELIDGRSLGQRASYRSALGVDDDRRLVLVSSTWGPTSLIGRDPELPARLLASLPYDEYRVALVLHPNVWAAHSTWQIRALQASAVEAGLTLIPVHSWRPALLAADLLVGDHGSVTLYGAALGAPVLLGAFGEDAVPGTAADSLARAARRLDVRGNLRRQVEDALRSDQQDLAAAVSEDAFAEPGHAHARLRDALYRLIRLPEPQSSPRPPVLGAPEPISGTGVSPTALRVKTTLTAEASEWPTVAVERVPGTVADPVEEHGDHICGHLACHEDEGDRRLAESASVVFGDGTAASTAGAVRWIAQTLGRFPGCLLAATGTVARTGLVGLRDGRIVTVAATGRPLEPGLAAAVVYALLRASRLAPDACAVVRIGERTEDVVLRMRPSGAAPLP
ncbi:hypothetical protein K378_02502 [Streptomyces sp. Amel2xB2]|uniref:hypothetical protein n=1 Tax=Streptomyces sp. Amel2xB2 TaxID=1305829 RepID=UPI000DC03EBF|nr:hypothetical protein [Streptomyces sp. Amel2xB2]RAJ67136.1 hypothetical protein K378_02502 [Streptomyces sp. Amel2xB2]